MTGELDELDHALDIANKVLFQGLSSGAKAEAMEAVLRMGSKLAALQSPGHDRLRGHAGASTRGARLAGRLGQDARARQGLRTWPGSVGRRTGSGTWRTPGARCTAGLISVEHVDVLWRARQLLGPSSFTDPRRAPRGLGDRSAVLRLRADRRVRHRPRRPVGRGRAGTTGPRGPLRLVLGARVQRQGRRPDGDHRLRDLAGRARTAHGPAARRGPGRGAANRLGCARPCTTAAAARDPPTPRRRHGADGSPVGCPTATPSSARHRSRSTCTSTPRSSPP